MSSLLCAASVIFVTALKIKAVLRHTSTASATCGELSDALSADQPSGCRGSTQVDRRTDGRSGRTISTTRFSCSVVRRGRMLNSVVKKGRKDAHHRDAENTEDAQRFQISTLVRQA